MADRTLGRLTYVVDAENNVSRGLADAAGEVQAWERGIDATKARIEVEADLKGLEKDLAEAKAMAKAMSAEKIRMDIEGDTDGVQKMEHALKNLAEQQKIVEQHQLVRTQDLRNIKAAERATTSQRSEVAKLGEEYAKLYTKRRKIDDLDRGTTSRERILGNRVKADMERVGAAIRRAGGNVDDFKVDLDRNNRTLRGWLTTIGKSRVSLGFFSTTVRSAGVILTTLGPVLLSVIGAAGAAIGTLGAGIAGAAAVGAAGLAGFALSAVGAGIALKEPIHQLGVAKTASQAYADAVQKYGRDSSQAKDKQDQLNQALKGLPPQAQKAVTQLGQMRAEFLKLGGQGIRNDFFNSFAQGIQTAKALLPTFATESRKTFHAASQGVNEWFKALRSPEGKQAIADIMGNFSKSIPSIMSGLGAIGATFGRIMQSASTFLPSLTQGFSDWAHSIEDSVGSGDQLTSRIGRLVHSMQQVGHFAQAAASGLTTLFSIASGPGGGLFDSMTRSLKRWNDEMKRDPRGTRDFFQQSVDTFRQLGPAVGRILMSLGNLAEAFAPATEAIAGFLNLVTRLVTALSGLPFGKTAIQALGLAYAINKIGTALALTGLLGGGVAGRAAGAGGLLGTLFSKRGVAAAAESTAAVEGTEAAITGATVASGGWAAKLGEARLAVAGVAGPVLLLGGAAALLSQHFAHADSLLGPFNADIRDFYKGNRQATQATQDLADAQRTQASTQKTINNLTEKGKTDTQGFAQAYDQHISSINRGKQAQQQQQRGIEQQTTAISSMQQKYESLAATLAQEKAAGQDKGFQADMFKQQAAALAQMSKQLNLAKINFNRFQHGLGPVGTSFLASINRLRSAAGQKFALKFETSGTPQVLSHLAQVTAKAKQLGATKAVMKILANSSNAEQAAARVDALLHSLHDKRVRISQSGAQSASAAVASLAAEINALHDKAVTLTVNHRIGGVGDQGAGANAAGTTNWRGGPSIVNERGPEMAMMNGVAWMLGNGRSGPQLDYVPKNAAILTARETAKLLRAGFPAFAKGKKAKKQAKAGTAAATSLGDRWTSLSDDVDFWGTEYDQDRRSYDSGIGTGGIAGLGDTSSNPTGQLLNEMLHDLQVQIDDYNLMIPMVGQIKGLTKQKSLKNPKNKKSINKINELIDARNSATDDAKGDLLSVGEIRHNVQALELEKLEIQSAKDTNTLVGQITSDKTRFDLYKQFAGNLIPASSMALPSGGLGTQSSFPALNSASPSLANAVASGSSVGQSTPGSGQHGASGGGGVTIHQTFAAPPPDAHVWAQNTVFEITAAGA